MNSYISRIHWKNVQYVRNQFWIVYYVQQANRIIQAVLHVLFVKNHWMVYHSRWMLPIRFIVLIVFISKWGKK